MLAAGVFACADKVRVEKLANPEGFPNYGWKYQRENFAWWVMLHVECYRTWENLKDTSEVDRGFMNEGEKPRRSKSAAVLSRRF